jgi:hypothetical protein
MKLDPDPFGRDNLGSRVRQKLNWIRIRLDWTTSDPESNRNENDIYNP